MIETDDGGTISIDIEFVLNSSTDLKSKIQVDEENNNSEIEDNDLD